MYGLSGPGPLNQHQVWMTSGCIPMHVAPAPPLCTPQCPVPPHAPPTLCMGSTHHNYTCWHRRSSQQSRTFCVQIPPCPGGRAHVPHHIQFMHTACNRTRQLKPRDWCQWWWLNSSPILNMRSCIRAVWQCSVAQSCGCVLAPRMRGQTASLLVS